MIEASSDGSADIIMVRLIASVPGFHVGRNSKKWGHTKLRTILHNCVFDKKFQKSPLVYQFSSLGSLDEKWMPEFASSLSSGVSEDKTPLGLGVAQIIWPAADDVRCSLECHWSPLKNLEKGFLNKYWAKWKATHTGRWWFLRTSANLSKAARGALQKNNSQLMIPSYELGGFFIPSIIKHGNAFSCTDDLNSSKDCFKSFRSETHILVVDVDIIYADLLAEVLKHFSYKVTLAKSGQDALSLLSDRTGKFDLVLIDAGLINANLSFLFQEPIVKEVPFILMARDHDQYSVAAMEALRNGAYFYLKKPISIENIKRLWGHAVAAKFPRSNLRDNSKRVLQSNPHENNETINYEKNKANQGKNIGINESINGNGTSESARKRTWKSPFTSDVYQFGHEGCNTSKDLHTMNDEPAPAMQIVSPVQKHYQGPQKDGTMPSLCMPVDVAQPLPSEDAEVALEAYQIPLAENNVDTDDHIDPYLEEFFLNDGTFDFLEDIAPLLPNFGMIDNAILEEGIDNGTLDMIPNSNELINNHLPPTMQNESFPNRLPPIMEDESFPSWIDSLLLDESEAGNGF